MFFKRLDVHRSKISMKKNENRTETAVFRKTQTDFPVFVNMMNSQFYVPRSLENYVGWFARYPFQKSTDIT